MIGISLVLIYWFMIKLHKQWILTCIYVSLFGKRVTFSKMIRALWILKTTSMLYIFQRMHGIEYILSYRVHIYNLKETIVPADQYFSKYKKKGKYSRGGRVLCLCTLLTTAFYWSAFEHSSILYWGYLVYCKIRFRQTTSLLSAITKSLFSGNK